MGGFRGPLGVRLACLLLASASWFVGATSGAYAATGANGEIRGEGFRSRILPVPAEGRSGFVRLAPTTTGIAFTNRLAPTRSLTNHILLNGSGVALGDVDGDGRTDIYLGGLDGPDALYRNEGGWRFREITPARLADPARETTGVTFADVDGDGDLDLLVNAIGRGTAGYLNPGDGKFDDATEIRGTRSAAGSVSMALADVDGDGDLDLYVANYRTSTIRDRFGMRLGIQRVNGRLTVTTYDGRPTTDPDLVGRFSVDAAGKLNENGEADVLFLNEGGGRFVAQSFVTGRFLDEDGRPRAEPPYDWSLSAMFRDMNRDGHPDLYVCGDLASPDRIWINQGDGRFRALRREALRKTSWFSMGVDFADLNGDGLDEFFVTDMVSRRHRLRQVQVSNHQAVPSVPGVIDDRPQAPRNTLFLNQGDGDWSEIAFSAGVEASDWSWAPAFLDVDLDGHEDILVATGFERDVQDIDVADAIEAERKSRKLGDAEALALRARFPSLRQAKLLFRNRGDLTFEEAGERWGFSDTGIGQGMALGDLDGDGDLDVVVNEMNGQAGIYRNESSAPRVAVRLRGRSPNTRGIGARIVLRGGAVPEQSQEVVAGGRYLSGDDGLRVFAAGTGSPARAMQIEVRWRGGTTSRVDEVVANRSYEIEEPAPSAGSTPRTVVAAPRDASSEGPGFGFVDLADRLAHVHAERYFDDFARQPLLPRRQSQGGPGIAWHDLDRDGWPDLVVGTGRGGGVGLFVNDRNGGFRRRDDALTAPVSRDLTGMVVVDDGTEPRILVGLSNYEGAPGEPASIMQLDPKAGTVTDAVPPDVGEPGPLAVADIDGDGDLDLFVGARSVPGRYPEPADSRLFRRGPKGWEPEDGRRAEFAGVGRVMGAVFSDLDGDGYPELALATEWGAVRVFRNDGAGGFAEVTEPWGFGQDTGWWQGIATADFDGDGRMDLVVSNWGTNTRYRPGPERPLSLYYGEFAGGDRVDMLEGYVDPETGNEVPWHHLGRVRAALPFVQERFPTFRAFGSASVREILGEHAAAARVLRARTLETSVFMNRTGRFERRALPSAAQRAPAFGVTVADFDGDGAEDVF
ncbi:MAG: VCBS repeat-containing protein, partial [Verrucomicrobiales bacterium]|nr:VCBS repeat-containing protein [Verrucomicrobiales bacterium]